jgi:DNA-binding SARP family transcriptional activator
MSVPSDTLWLTFFGRPALVSTTGEETQLPVRYRKGVGLLAWLAAQADRPLSRRAAAELLWPELDASAARANLRVVINHLSAYFAALGLAQAIDADREWIALRTIGRLVTDDMLRRDTALAAAFAVVRARRADMPWCEVEGLSEEGDFGEWLRARRAWFAAGDRPETKGETVEAPPTCPDAGPCVSALGAAGAHWRRLAILRVVLAGAALDERAELARTRERMNRLAEALAMYGARLVSGDAEGASFVFGLYARGGGLRLQLLSGALACLSMIPEARIGLTCGELFVESDGRTVHGRRFIRAARLALCAEPGEIAADDSLADLVAALALRSELRCFRGELDETPVFFLDPGRVRRSLHAPPAPEVPFFGRSENLEHLARLSVPGAKVTVVGPPGVGKTRLAQEFVRARREAVFWLFCRAEIAHEPWAVLVEWLSREDLGALLAQEADAIRRLVKQRHIGFSQRGALIRALARLSSDSLVVIDDAQWMDAATARLLDEVARQTSAAWLATRRPQEGGWQPPDAVCHELAPLDDAAARDLLISLSGDDFSERQQREALVRARGLPLFLIAEARTGSGAMADALAGLCNFPDREGDVLAAAAILGQQFQREDLAALVDEASVDDMLTMAAREGIVFAYRRDLWGFRHPLLRERCLAWLDPADMRRLASDAAARFQARGEAARAAELFEQAGDVRSARYAWLAAARAALAAEDAVAACALFEPLARLGYPEGKEGDRARIDHAKALIVRNGWGIAEGETLCQPIAQAHREPADEEARDLRFAAEALLYLSSGAASNISSLAQAERLVRLADTPQRHYAAIWAHADANFLAGDFATARRDFETLLESPLDLADRTRYFPSDPYAFLAIKHAWILWFMGESGWREAIEQRVAAVTASPLRQDECIAHVFAAAVYLSAGERAAFAAHAFKALDIAQAEAFALWEFYATLLTQIARAQEGVPPNGAACAAIEAAVQNAYPSGINAARWLMAEAWVAARRWKEALALLERALSSAPNSDHLYCLPDLHRLHATALAGLGRAKQARQAMDEACRLARANGFTGWLARWEA